ncbi:MAG: BspA family leucine-rich repeat surface protein [Bacilli bacterium]|nr:BspA family leucine-rich repeat surface protein [Bacilli bacterium]
MQKNKGFTLTELLAVIVILAIVALIATPLIMNIISEAKKGAFLDSSYAIVTAAEQGYAKSLIKEIDAEETEYTFVDGVKALKNGNISLDYKGSNPNYGNLIINDEGNVTINFYSNGFCATKGYDTDTITIRAVDAKEDCVPDVVAPVITLEDSDIMITTADTSYIEPGYSAIDDTDGDITSSVVITNDINYGEAGEYYITYTISDSAGNSTIITRKVIVFVESILKVATSGNDTTKYLDGPIAKSTIESIAFATTNEVPSGVIGSWDVSEDTDGSVMAWYKDTDNDGLYELTIGGNGVVYGNVNSSYLFSYLTNLSSINLNNFDTTKVTNMYLMFYQCSSLLSLNLSAFNTSNVTNMAQMFNSCTKLITLSINNFDTSKATNMFKMFYGCSSLTNLNISTFDTSKVTNMSYMFYNTNSLATLYFNNATFTLTTAYSNMFYGTKAGIKIYTKDSTTRTWLQSRLSESSITGTVTIA